MRVCACASVYIYADEYIGEDDKVQDDQMTFRPWHPI
jgi:hypothetical protein